MAEELLEGTFFRVRNISRLESIDTINHQLICKTLDLSEGVGIEKRLPDGNYFVVAFVKPTSYGEVRFEDVEFRSIFELDPTNTLMLEEFRNCVEFARNMLLDILEKKNKEVVFDA